MLSARHWLFISCFFLAVAAPLQFFAIQSYQPAFPPFAVALSSKLTNLGDFGGVILGARRLAADLAWIQTLQYYGTDEGGLSESELENGGGHYPLFLAYVERVAQLDPTFTYPYYYGGGVLGWNLNRLDEAETLLRLGVLNNPREWRLPQYLAALAYQKNHDPEKLVAFLEGYVAEKECPNLLRALLANLYKKRREYRRAIGVWLLVVDSGQVDDVRRAQEEILTLAALDHQKPQK